MSPKPPLPEDENERLAALRALNLLFTPSERRFDRITRLACWRLKVPVALISLVDIDMQWFKSRQGVEVCETSRDVSFCGYAILKDELFIIPDALLDPRFADNPFVTAEPYIRFYAGYPLKGPGNYRVGSFCVVDFVPRVFSETERRQLRELGEYVEYEMNRYLLKKQSMK